MTPSGPISSLSAKEQIARARGHGYIVTCQVCVFQWWIGRGDVPLGPEEACGRPECPQLVDVERKRAVREAA